VSKISRIFQKRQTRGEREAGPVSTSTSGLRGFSKGPARQNRAVFDRTVPKFGLSPRTGFRAVNLKNNIITAAKEKKSRDRSIKEDEGGVIKRPAARRAKLLGN